MRKRLCFLMLLALLCAELTPVCTAQKSHQKTAVVTWSYNEDTATLIISGAGDMENYGWDDAMPWYSFREQIATLVVQDGVLSLSAYAFFGCTALTDVQIAGTVQCLGDSVFSGCTALNRISIPQSVTAIGQSAFSGCSSLSEINIDAQNDSYCSIEGILYSKDTSALLVCPEKKAGAVQIPDSVTEIRRSAFENCAALTEISLPANLSSIGASAFKNCSALQALEIPQGVILIDTDTFRGCSSLERISLPDDLTTIGENAFFNCAQLSQLNLPDGLCTICCAAFSGCSSLADVCLPSGVTSIDSYTFADCKSLTAFFIPASLTYIGEGAYSGCTALTGFTVAQSNSNYCAADGILYQTGLDALVAFPAGKSGAYTVADSVSVICSGAFSGCTALTDVTVPSGVKSIQNRAFADCSALVSLTLDNGLETIGFEAFKGCTALTLVTLPDSVRAVEASAFSGCSVLCRIDVRNPSCAISCEAADTLGDSGITSVHAVISSTAQAYAQQFGYAFTEHKNGTCEICGQTPFTVTGTCGPTLSWLLDEAGVITVSGNGAMDNYDTCDVPWASYAQQIRSVVLDSGITGLCASAFSGCSALTAFHVAPENASYSTADGVLFHGSTLVCYPAGNPTTVYTVPATVTEIGMSAFAESQNLTDVILPQSVCLIGRQAFANSHALTALYFHTTDCVILSDEQTLGAASSVTIYAYRDSTAENYSNTYGYTFCAITDCANGRHDYRVTSQSATCTESGSVVYRCFVCGDTQVSTLPALGHDYREQQHLCVTVCTCNRCGDTYTIDTSVPLISGTTATPFNLPTWNETGNYFYFAPTQTDFYTLFAGLSANGISCTLTLYSASDCQAIGEVSSNNGALSLDFNAIAGQRYYICICGDDTQGQALVSLRLQQTHSFYQGFCEYCNTPETGYLLASGTCGENLSWSVTNAGALSITGSGAMTDYSAQPDSAAPWSVYSNIIQSLSLSDELTAIGAYAFFCCEALSAIDIPSGVTQVGEAAFAGCSIDLSLTLSDDCAGCCLVDGVLYDKAQAVLLYCSPAVTQKVIIPNSVKRIGEAAFYHCELLPSVTLSDGMQSIGAYAFYQCSALDVLTLPDNITRIEPAAFLGCSSLQRILLPARLTSIGDSAFQACAFRELILPESVTDIGKNAFSECSSLQRICIPDGVTTIRERAFYACASLEDLTLPRDLVEIKTSSFYNCSALTAVQIPSTVTHIADSAFYNCIYLHEVLFCGDAPTLGSDVFRSASASGSVNIYDLYLSYFSYNDGWTTPLWNGYSTRMIAHDEHTFAEPVDTPATCTEDGSRNFTCTVCGYCYTEAIPAVGHTMVFDTQVPATCTENGSRSFMCTVCGYSRTETIAATGHTPVIDAEVPATCIASGLTQGARCSVCDTILTAQQPVAAFGHSYSAVLTAPPDCTNDGIYTYTCAVCGDSYKKSIPAVGHTPVTVAAIAATCTVGGLTQGEYCALCNAVLIAQQPVDALEHSYAEEITSKATCTAEGIKTFTCTRCGSSYTQAIAVLPHNFVDCVCTVCGKIDYAQILAEFTDLPPKGNWAYDGIAFAVQNGLFNGTSTTRFEPDGLMTRAMLVTVLWRYDGQRNGIGSFSDVPTGEWYTDAVAWAAQQQIVNGVGGGRFDPNGKITREQLATILYRYCLTQGIDVSTRDTLVTYPDAAKVSAWALDAVRWAVAAGLVNGVSGHLAPQSNATRAQVATIFMRLSQNITTPAEWKIS